MKFESSILTPDPQTRTSITTILEAALDAVDPVRATGAVLDRDGDRLYVDGQAHDLNQYQRIIVVGAGKAAAPMSQAIEYVLGDRIDTGQVVTKTGHLASTSRISVVEANHPVPNQAGVDAGTGILDLVSDANHDDLVIVLLSGGGSALLVAPADGLHLQDIQDMTDIMLSTGATIQEINCLRKHASAVKGGQLARAAAPATVVTLALSDVIGSPLDVIASGPTVPDQTTWQDVWSIVRRYDIEERLPALVLERFRAGLEGEIPDTPKAGDPVFAKTQNVVIADNRVAALAARAKAQELGYHCKLLTTFLEGEAAQVARVMVALGKEVQTYGQPLAIPACLILGGETTVSLGQNPGRGGRNQELALAAAIALQDTTEITVVSLATDGTDGPTDSAGGIADGSTVERGRADGLDAEEHLRTHNAYPFLTATNDLLRTGPTNTNVNDLVFVFVGSP